MATLAVPNSITNTSTADATEVQGNFTEIETFCNDDVLHVDGTKQLTGLLSLKATDPTADDHAVRKKYVDDLRARVGGEWTDIDSATTIPDAVWTVITFDTEVSDTDAIGTAGGNTFTVPTGKGGIWGLHASFASWFTGVAAGVGRDHAAFIIDGTYFIQPADVFGDLPPHNLVLPLAAGATVQVAYMHDSSGNVLGLDTTFEMFRIAD